MPTIAQRLRKTPTSAEIRFWRVIEPLRTGGYHFRKQVALGSYVVDFACHAARIVIEIDGDSHFDDAAIRRDGVREAYLNSRGYRVLRFTNGEVMNYPEGVYARVIEALEQPPPWPSPQGRG
jgi:very-short-patch-repair endonuclease